MAPDNRLSEKMDANEHRQIARDSLFVMADLRLPGREDVHRIKVRNLSAGGMMGEGPVRVTRGTPIQVNIRNIGWVDGAIAWVQDDRFGIAFTDEIDPKVARAPVAVSKPATSPIHAYTPRPTRALRKI
jgi:hypothetical protein